MGASGASDSDAVAPIPAFPQRGKESGITPRAPGPAFNAGRRTLNAEPFQASAQ